MGYSIHMTTTENTTTAQLTAAMAALAEAKTARQNNRCWTTTAAVLKAEMDLRNLLPEEFGSYAEMYTATAGTSDAALVEKLILAAVKEA